MGICLWIRRTFGVEWLTAIDGALAAALLSAALMGWVHLKYRQREDTVIAAIWATGMSIGVVFIALTPGYNVELMNYLFGNILWVSHTDLKVLFSLAFFVLVMATLFHRRFVSICFDEEQALLQKLHAKKLYFLLLSLVALSVVLLIQVVGAILVIAMLTLPAAIASNYTHRLSLVMLIAVLLGCLFTLLGIEFSYALNWPPGATISLVATLFYILSLVKRRARVRPLL
jgi:zinc transport system permease protein